MLINLIYCHIVLYSLISHYTLTQFYSSSDDDSAVVGLLAGLYFHEASTVSLTLASKDARFDPNKLAACELAADDGFGSGRRDWILVRRADTS